MAANESTPPLQPKQSTQYEGISPMQLANRSSTRLQERSTPTKKQKTTKKQRRLQQQLEQADRQQTLAASITVNWPQNAASNAMDRAKTYHRYIRKGFDPVRYPTQSATTEQFMASIMLEDMQSSDFTGRQVFMQQWQAYTNLHTDLECVLAGMELVAVGRLNGNDEDQSIEDSDHIVVTTYGETRLRIARKTIEVLFPHILPKEELVQLLIGKEYAMGWKTKMHFNRDGRIFHFDSQVDLPSGLLPLLQDPALTMEMVQSAMMTKGGNLLTQAEVQEDLHRKEDLYV